MKLFNLFKRGKSDDSKEYPETSISDNSLTLEKVRRNLDKTGTIKGYTTAKEALDISNNYGHNFKEALDRALGGVRLAASIGEKKTRLVFWDDYKEDLKGRLADQLNDLGYQLKEIEKDMYITWEEENEQEK